MRPWGLSAREYELLTELALHGGTNAQIGSKLHISEGTVKAHFYKAQTKMGVRTKHDMVRLWWTRGRA